jgi:hypothetical protein
MSTMPPERARLSARLAVIKQTHGDEIKRLEGLRKTFVRNFSRPRLARLPIDDYVIGQRQTSTFCYRIERQLDGLGRILGTPARKFGVFFSQKRGAYQHTSIWGTDPHGAYERLRAAILQLLNSADAGDTDALNASRISPMFKGKILHLYFPEKFAPIYSPDHLRHFIARLNLPTAGESSVELQQALMAYRRNEPLLRSESAVLMMRWLYDEFPPGEKDADAERSDDPPISLSEAVAGLKELAELPIGGDPAKSAAPPKPGKFDTNSGRRKIVGDRGEHLVVAYERNRLLSAGRSDLAKKIDRVAARDDSQGFDILSFDADGTPRPIEVKSTTGTNLSRGFFVTENERAASKKDNYYLYFVFRALSAEPEIFPLKTPDLGSPMFSLRPTQYHVGVKQI